MSMPETARAPLRLSYRALAWAVLAAGLVAGALSFFRGREEEWKRAEQEFEQRALVRHALTREILGHYEEALFGLSSLFVSSEEVTLAEFRRATDRLMSRVPGVKTFQWVPVVPGGRRAELERRLTESYGGRRVELTELGPAGERRPVRERAVHYPIAWVNPLSGNDAALGYDLQTGPTLAALERARSERALVLTQQVRLVQETADKLGVVMIWPVHRTTPDGADTFSGFLQTVLRVHDFLETSVGRQPETMLDLLFLDAEEPQAERQVLYFQPAAGAGGAAAPERVAEFRAGVHRELPLTVGGRGWRLLLRPQAGWIESQRTTMPYLRSASLVLVAGLVAGIVVLTGRRTQTIRREVELRTAELAESRRQLALMLDALPGMAYRSTYDEQMRVQFVSDGATALTGWRPEEFVAERVHFRECIHPDDLGRVREETRRALLEKTDVEVEFRIRTRDGTEKWVLSRGRGVYGDGGRLRFCEGLAIDITAQKEAEAARLKLERKLLESQKLESLGLLAGGIAHDFNNLLSSVLGNANLVRLQLPAGSAADESLAAIEAATLRAAELCRQMLAYAGKGRFAVEPTDLTRLVEELMPLLKVSVAHQGAMRLELARDLPAVAADATQLRQIVMNLVTNAAEAVAGRRGEIVVTTGTMTADAAYLARCAAGAELAAGTYVYLEVRDNGCGMAEDVQRKIFDPFFTTKFAGRGLGLAAVLGIVRGHRGALHVTSAPERGSTFRLLLPPVAEPAAVRPAAPAAGAPWRQRGTVLVVEDEEPVRVVVGEILKSFGFAVRLAAGGPEGVAAFREDPKLYRLTLLDLVMPETGGEEVLERLRAIDPDVRVLLMSGYNEGDVLRRLAAPRGRLGFAAKPFTRAALEAKLREMLD